MARHSDGPDFCLDNTACVWTICTIIAPTGFFVRFVFSLPAASSTSREGLGTPFAARFARSREYSAPFPQPISAGSTATVPVCPLRVGKQYIHCMHARIHRETNVERKTHTQKKRGKRAENMNFLVGRNLKFPLLAAS
jgi:hypothetical protein